MANEAVPVELGVNGGNPVDFTVASGAAIDQYTILKLADPRTAAASSSTDVFAGIAAAAKKSDDYSTNLSAYTSGIFKLTAAPGATITAGGGVVLSGANLIKQGVAGDLLTGATFGKAMESIASATTGEVMVGTI